MSIRSWRKAELLRIDEIIPAEDIEEPRLKHLLASLREKKVLHRPIIVEHRKMLVIDGHHRLRALEASGAKLVPVILADYRSDVRSVGRWMYIGSWSIDRETVLKRGLEELEHLVKRGGSRKIEAKVRNETMSIKADRLDAYISLKYSELLRRVMNELTKVPFDEGKCRSSEICLSFAELEIDDMYRIPYTSLLPPRSTLHETSLKEIEVPFKLNDLGGRF
ncbi:MAG: ParB N-terminal domain-containing protein [Fervidicoccaceae archaeon]